MLAVCRDAELLRTIWTSAGSNGWQTEIAATLWDALDRLQSGMLVDVLLVELPAGDRNGLQVLHWIRRISPELPLVLFDPVNDPALKRLSQQLGAVDYVVGPMAGSRLDTAIHRGLGVASAAGQVELNSEQVEPLGENRFFVGLSPLMRKVRAQAARLAETDLPVLISGEPGSGRETVARLLHSISVRSGSNFLRVDCAALPEDMLERELLGYRCASPGMPTKIRPGKLERASGGTIFLNDIAQMSARLQSIVAEVIVTGRFARPDASEMVEADVRVIAAVSTAARRSVSRSHMAAGLSRLFTPHAIQVPPLRERKDEIPLLARFFLHELTRQYGRPQRSLSEAAAEAWKRYQWPGNLDELQQVVKRYLVSGEFDPATADSIADVPDEIGKPGERVSPNGSCTRPPSFPPIGNLSGNGSLRSLLQCARDEAEKNAIEMALERTSWNRKAAARLLKVSYRTILYKIEQYQLSVLDQARDSNGIDAEDGSHRHTWLPGSQERSQLTASNGSARLAR